MSESPRFKLVSVAGTTETTDAARFRVCAISGEGALRSEEASDAQER